MLDFPFYFSPTSLLFICAFRGTPVVLTHTFNPSMSEAEPEGCFRSAWGCLVRCPLLKNVVKEKKETVTDLLLASGKLIPIRKKLRGK